MVERPGDGTRRQPDRDERSPAAGVPSGASGADAPTGRLPGRGGADRARLDARMALTVAIGVAGGLLLLSLIEILFGRLEGLLIAILISLFLSFAMEPAVQWMARHNMRRGFATVIVFLVGMLLFGGFVAAMWPLVASQITNLVESGPDVVAALSRQAERLPGGLGESVSSYLDDATLPSNAQVILGRLGGGLLGFGTTILSGVIQFLTILLVTFYLVADGHRLRRAVSSWLPSERQANVLAIWELAIEKTGGYVYGRALVAVVSAAFHALVFTLIGVPYAIALGVWVGVVSSLVPVVGTYIAGALPLVIGLASDNPINALWVVIAVVVYQQIENYLVAPRITAHTMALHPAVAFVSVLAGGALLGAVGALLALPAAAIIGGVVSAIGERHDIVEHELLMTVPVPREGGQPSTRGQASTRDQPSTRDQAQGQP